MNTNCVLDIDRSKNNNGTKVQLWNYEGNKNQKFKIVQRYRGEYVIYANTSNFTKCLSVKDGSKNYGEIVHQWEYTGARERWTINRVITTTNVTHRDGFQILNVNVGISGWFYFIPPENGYYYIETVGGKDTILKVTDFDAGKLLVTADDNGGYGGNEKVYRYLTANKRYRIDVSYTDTMASGKVGVTIY